MSTTDHDLTARGATTPAAREIDADRLSEITDRDGFAVFDPTSPGAVRELTEGEQDHLRHEIEGHAETDVDGTHWCDKSRQLWTESERSEAYLESRPVGGPYDPTLEYGDPDWREPESDSEAAARTAYLDQQRPAAVEVSADRSPSALREVEDALAAAQLEAYLSDRAHDLDPAPGQEVERLEALRDQLDRDAATERRTRHERAREEDELDEDEDEDER